MCVITNITTYALTAQLINAFVFSLHIYIYTSLIRNFKRSAATSCVYTARLVSGLVENPKDRFSHEAAQFETAGQTDRQRERERERERLMIDDLSNYFYSL